MMAEFDDSDLRPFTGSGFRRASTASVRMTAGSDDTPPTRGQTLPPPSRPSTTMSASHTRPESAANMGLQPPIHADPQNRPVTSYTSRPTTAAIPQWMFEEDNGGGYSEPVGSNRPKTGFRPGTSRTSISTEVKYFLCNDKFSLSRLYLRLLLYVSFNYTEIFDFNCAFYNLDTFDLSLIFLHISFFSYM